METLQKILIVDDSEMNRALLADMLEGEYDILEAEDGLQAVEILRKQRSSIDIVLLDIVMPYMDGFGVLASMNENHWIEDIPVIMISSETSAAQVSRAYEMGVSDFITRPFNETIVRRRLNNTIILYANQKKLVGMVNDQIREKEQRSNLMIDVLSHIVEFRNGESGLHILHVRRMTDILLECLTRRTGQYHLSAADIALIGTASALHDIGKIAIDDKILNKPGKLTDEEFAIMKTHSAMGAQMLDALTVHKDDPLVRTAYQICRWHHERYDGRGYPDGLKGDEIPISAQVVALADVYDALTSERVYKKAFTHEKAVQMILNGECGAFNPLLLDCLKDASSRFVALKSQEEPEAGVDPMSYRELQASAKELLGKEETTASDRTLRLLDYERMKYSFFADLTEEIQFEYTISPNMLSFTPKGAKKLGLPEIIMDPAQDDTVQQIIGPGNWKALSELLRSTNPEEPRVEFLCKLNLPGESRWHRLIARSTWSMDSHPLFMGALGKLLDVHDTQVLLEELEQRASRDRLTGLLNRASGKEQIDSRLAQLEPGRHASLAFFDIDFFKQINDQFGHAIGDKALKFVADRLLHSTRGHDVCCRFGGDEFILYLEYAENIERIMARIFSSLSGNFGPGEVSVSMGVACTTVVPADYESLLHAADQALYAVKRSGKGKCLFYDESMADILSAPSTAIDEGDGIEK